MYKKVLAIRRSCISGNIVWVCNSLNKRASYVTYNRACKAEKNRVEHYAAIEERRQREILKMLNDCLAEIPITVPLTDEQTAAARSIRQIAKEHIECDHLFYDHVKEEERRKNEDAKIRAEMRQRQQSK